jgi:23S rRNA A2030 N6-methylase RlmJ
MLSLFIYLMVLNYNQSRTSSFITLDQYAGVCVDNLYSTTCCEVPQSITGIFLLDNKARWNTESNFDYQRAVYSITMTGVQYTNEQWFALMRSIQDELYEIGYIRGRYRDFSWNLIAWASFTAVQSASGF